MKEKVLILAAGSIENRLSYIKAKFNTPGLIPINSQSVIKLIVSFYVNSLPEAEIYIATNKKDLENIEDELSAFKHYHFIEVPPTEGVNETLEFSLSEIGVFDSIIVNVVTTIPTGVAKVGQVFLSSEIEHNKYYSSIEIGEDGVRFNLKNNRETDIGWPFTGIFCFERDTIIQSLKKCATRSDLLEVVKCAAMISNLEYIKVDWIDVGHEINYFRSRKKIIFSRSFNKLEISKEGTIITKKSLHWNKFQNEVRYVDMLPAEIRLYYPKVIDQFSIVNDMASVSMEYYSYPNISEYQLYWNLDSIYWERIFKNFYNIIHKFRSNRFSIGIGAHNDFYFNKTNDRYIQFRKILINNSEPYLNEEIIINNQICSNYEQLQVKIKARIAELYSEDHFCIMHGDLCFNNILYDYVGDSLKLIDPRGSFGEKCVGIYGDIKYDIAKLVHSSIFCYDYIVNDLFLYSYENGRHSYQFKLRDNQELLKELTIDLINKLGYKKEDIFFIVGLLFIGMCSLHNDNFERQRIMYLHGLKILNENL